MPRALVREAIAEVMTDVPEPEAVARAFNLRRRQRGLDLSKPADFQRARAYLLRQGFSEAAVGDFLRPLRRRLAETRADDET
jgi:hypothetical protein